MKGWNWGMRSAKGAVDRLRPVLMTASIAIFSLMPMLLAQGTGSEIQKPLATVVVGGLITSTLLTCCLSRRCMAGLRSEN